MNTTQSRHRLLRPCTAASRLEIEPADLTAYDALACFHYRPGAPRCISRTFAVWDRHPRRAKYRLPAAVIVYAMPPANLAVRNAVTAGRYTAGDRTVALRRLNAEVRIISRVIVDPRYRGLGVASWLVAATIPLVPVPLVEALSSMARVHSFFERAGMQAFPAPPALRVVRLIEALSAVGVEPEAYLDPDRVHTHLMTLHPREQHFIESEFRRFLTPCTTRRDAPPGPDRTRYILSRLAARPVYCIARNPAFTDTAHPSPDKCPIAVPKENACCRKGKTA